MRVHVRRVVAATSTLLVGALTLTACGGGGGTSTSTSEEGGTSGAAPAGGTLTIANVFDNNSFDRAALEIGNRVQYWMPVYDTLLLLDPKAELQPNLATEWSYNEDNTVLNLKLREGVTFTDGTPFDGEAVKANLEHLAKGSGQNSYMARSIAEVQVVSPTEVNLVLTAPDPGLLGYLAVVGGAIASPATLGAPDAATNPVGTGPYTLDTAATVPGSSYEYDRNPDYWNADAFPYDTVVVKPIQDPTARLNALKSGQVDAGQIEPKSIAEAEGSGLDIERNPVDWFGLFIADREGATVPALGDVRVRQAINMVIDKEAILKNLQRGEGEVTSQTFNPLSQAYDEKLDSHYEHDAQAAKELMADAGYEDGFTVAMPDLAISPQVAPIIDQQLSELNITVEWTKVAADASVSEVLSGKFPMFYFSLGSQSAWQDLNKFAFPTSPWNTAKVEDPELTALLDKARAATDDEQDAAMQDVNTWLVENAWFAPWYRINMVTASSADVDVTPQAWNAAPWIRNYTPAS